jgi:hypothetical protein
MTNLTHLANLTKPDETRTNLTKPDKT